MVQQIRAPRFTSSLSNPITFSSLSSLCTLPPSPQLYSPFILCNPSSSSSSRTSHNPLLSQSSAPSLSPSVVLYLSLPLFFPPSSHLQPARAPPLPCAARLLSFTFSLSLSLCYILSFISLSVSFSLSLPSTSLQLPEACRLAALPSTTEDSEPLGTKTLSLEVSVLQYVCVCVLVVGINLHQRLL